MSITTEMAGCPACGTAGLVKEYSKRLDDGAIALSLPSITCAGCIASVERLLTNMPEVADARVNLTLKRAQIWPAGDVAIDASDIADRLTKAGYEAHELDSDALQSVDDPARALLLRLGIAGFAMMNVMLLSVAVWSGAEAATRDMFHWISGLIAIPVVAYSGQPFFRSAAQALSAWRLNMDVPISLALILAVGMSLGEVILSGEDAYFDAAISLTFFLLAGRYLEQKSRGAARSAAQELTALEVPRAHRIKPNGQRDLVPVSELRIGQQVFVAPGAPVPTDAEIIKGESELDRSILTGETRPIPVTPGDQVTAGEVNLTGPLTLRVAANGRDHSLNRLAELVSLAEGHRNRYSTLADKAAQIYAPVVHLLSFVAFLLWLWVSGGDVRLSLNIAVSVLIITCPCALGLAVPAVVAAASGGLFRKGLLLKHGTALERLAEVDCVVFDKTGTLTNGTLAPEGLTALSKEAAAVTRALAEASVHPLARALAAELTAKGVPAATLSKIKEIPGKGIEGDWNGINVRLGRAEWIGIAAGQGTQTVLKIGKETHVFSFHDQLRTEVPELCQALNRMGIELHILSGDAADAVENVAETAGIGHWQANATPEDKIAYIEALTAAGQKTLVVGDGLNDTGALTAGHVSAAPASALAAARVASDIVVTGQSLGVLSGAINLAQKSRRRILENFGIAVAYNSVAIPLALLGFATPLAAALAMSLSSITVSLNALRVRRL